MSFNHSHPPRCACSASVRLSLTSYLPCVLPTSQSNPSPMWLFHVTELIGRPPIIDKATPCLPRSLTHVWPLDPPLSSQPASGVPYPLLSQPVSQPASRVPSPLTASSPHPCVSTTRSPSSSTQQALTQATNTITAPLTQDSSCAAGPSAPVPTDLPHSSIEMANLIHTQPGPSSQPEHSALTTFDIEQGLAAKDAQGGCGCMHSCRQ